MNKPTKLNLKPVLKPAKDSDTINRKLVRNNFSVVKSNALAELINSEYPEYGKQELRDLFWIFTQAIENLVQSGYQVQFEGFGTFTPKYNKPRTFWNVHHQKYLPVDETLTFMFTAANSLQERTKQRMKVFLEDQPADQPKEGANDENQVAMAVT